MERRMRTVRRSGEKNEKGEREKVIRGHGDCREE